jgi:glycerol-3-phosphate acyltransferase PlsY
VLAVVSLALAAVAWKMNVEALGATAALGAFVAPILLGRQTAEADLLLVYLATMAAGLGWVAAARRWRLAAFVVAASYFTLGGLAAPDATPLGVVAYAAIGGAAGLILGLRRRWWETRFLAFGGSWTMLAIAADSIEVRVFVLAGALLLAAPVWAHTLRLGPRWPLDESAGSARAVSVGELLYFVATPLLVALALRFAAQPWFDARSGLLALVIAIPYLLAGYLRLRPAFAAVGVSALALAILLQWPGLAAPAALVLLALAAAAADRPLHRGDGRAYSLGLLAIALLHVTEHDRLARPAAEPAFIGPWALALWGVAAAAALLAQRLWRRADDPGLDRLVRGGLWTAAGMIALLGVTAELRRAFGGAGGAASLAGELSVSAWWLAAAAALVTLGFARGLKPVRVAGLAVAGLAVAKVTFSDLAALDALYRVASVFILGLVSLSLAYLYHRKARREAPAPAVAPLAAAGDGAHP